MNVVVVLTVLVLALLSGWLILSERNRDLNSETRNWPGDDQ